VIEEDVIAPETTLFDPGNLLLPNRYAPNDEAAAQNFVCWKRDGHGALNMIGGISQSCDVYFYLVGGGSPDLPESVLRSGGLGINDLFRHATALGIGSELGVELPGEVAGRMRDPDWKRRIYGENWSTGDTYNASFGQGYITTTPLQLLFSSAALINGGILYQPTIIHSVLDDEGNVLQPFEPHILRTVNLDAHPDPTQPIKLMLVEDMIMKGESSLACLCEPNSQFFNELRCNPETYRNTVNINDDPFTPELREYTVHIPHNYVFNASVCDPLRFNVRYQPAFVGETALQIVEQGMRATVTAGTAQAANLPYVAVAGKTGTAEYCDDVAWQLNLCLPGNWPAHAWFTAYAPYEDPEIMVIAFLYNGGEGSLVALPVVMETIEAYYRLKVEREGQLIIPIMEDVS
jgi:cell division protein FtsI/penicillin-binding protein 2